MTEKVLAACFEVANELGSGFVESVYEKALLIALRQRGIQAECQVPLKVVYLKATGIEIGLLINFGNSKLEYRRLHR